jgi:hypothetical protein
MAIQLKVRNNKQIVVPLRFARAQSGAVVADAPDVDDRGFAMGTRPGTWGSTDARGAMVSITQGDTVRIKVVRSDIDDAAPLYAVSSNTSVLTIAGPSGPLGSDGVFSVRAAVDAPDDPVKIQICLGSEKGPVLGELEPHIFQLRQVRVRAHLVTISGVPTARTAATLQPLFREANKIWRAAGIEFLYDSTATLTETISLSVPGQTSSAAEFCQVLQLTPDPAAINIYFNATSTVCRGGTINRTNPRPTGFGIILTDQADGNDLAHELGHFLGDYGIHAGDNAASKHFRDDVWAERRLMYPFNPLGGVLATYRHDVTYGNLKRGSLISVKDFSLDPSDGEVARNRRTALESLNPGP